MGAAIECPATPITLKLPNQIFAELACVADETKPRYSPSANQGPKACSVLPGFSIIGSYWLLHMAVLSCTVIGQVDLVEPWLLWRLRSR